MNRADTMLPAKPLLTSGGQISENGSSGSVANAGKGFQTNPMAARWGSRLNKT